MRPTWIFHTFGVNVTAGEPNSDEDLFAVFANGWGPRAPQRS